VFFCFSTPQTRVSSPADYEDIILKVLLSKCAKVYIAARSQEKSQKAIDELKKETGNESVFFLKLDLTDLVTIKAAAEEFIGKEPELHGLYNNAYVPRVLCCCGNSMF
jgi:NAD(P)-dependent dehydrogenase (short-subunit alcohol dehydrogenase family)